MVSAEDSGTFFMILQSIPCESIKSLHFDNVPLFSCGTKKTSNLTHMERITSPASIDTFVGKMFMFDCPSLKLGNSV